MTTKQMQETAVPPTRPRTLVAAIVSLIALGLVIAALVNTIAAQNGGRQTAPPPNFQPAAQIDLLARSYDNETLAQITLDQATNLGVFFVIKDISTEYFDLSLNGPSGFHVLILHSEEYRTDGAGARSLQGFALQPGEYQLVLTSRQSPGRLSVHWGSLGQN
ncbi:MAG: hypothetical protein KBE23_11570 [Chloroflexi bacterium]|nr:hypothetical protein [Chloroflexota bacterium]MBP7043373.1 hypothetical protein [Chloroflexota bacterium]